VTVSTTQGKVEKYGLKKVYAMTLNFKAMNFCQSKKVQSFL
jgi:hypothetical protein